LLGTNSPYNTTLEYQRLVSSLAYSSTNPPTTRVSADGMTISYKEHSLHIPKWRNALDTLCDEIEAELNELCGPVNDLSFHIPDDTPDDWTNTTRGYSWIKNGQFVRHKRGLVGHLMQQKDLKLAAVGRDDNLIYNMDAIHDCMKKSASINWKLGVASFTTDGQDPRMAEFVDHKIENSTRPRTVLRSNGELWMVTRRVKWEKFMKKEAFIPIKCNPRIQRLMERYLLVVRPMEQDFAYLLWGEEAKILYKEYLYMDLGRRMTDTAFSQHLRHVMKTKANCDVGGHDYRQLVVQIGRVFLGSEHEMDDEEEDLLALQRGHSWSRARFSYATEVGHLPCMSSDQLLRFGRVSEGWWEVAGFKPGRPAMLPLMERHKITSTSHCCPSVGAGESPPISAFDQQAIIHQLTATMVNEIGKLQATLAVQIQQSVAAGIAEALQRKLIPSVPLSPLHQEHLPLPEMLAIDASNPSGPPISQPNIPIVDSGYSPNIEEMYMDLPAISTPPLQPLLQKLFPNDPNPQFKSPEQCQMCELAISRERNFVGILPTGGGKSLVFMLPALQEANYYTIVVAPHKALLNDHLRKVKAAGIKCMQWTTGTKTVDDDIRIIFLALETATSLGFRT
jgi:hypothetical protein